MEKSYCKKFEKLSKTTKVSSVLKFSIVACAFAPQLARATVGYFFTKNSLMSDANIQAYTDTVPKFNTVQTIFTVDFNPLTANHVRDLKKIREALQEFSKKATEGIVLFGYSATSKFVAKLASENFNIKALFLIDPVDGTPPFSSKQNFPIFLDENTQINVPTSIVQSEFGTQPWMLGLPCVPEGLGAEFFAQHVNPNLLKFVKIPGSGHIDFMSPPVSKMVEATCKAGTAVKTQVRSVTQTLFKQLIAPDFMTE